ncbi:MULTISPECIES: sulfurtransferase [unclassified Cytobacillus]|uniref:sulfurtransferase n=1 Tax=unclassified Cytobacillus TaxID=2675268 RepID=UPI00135A3A94|nr:sulfurtransferase [Cytobacillus sp. AMY 15.2]KAF0818725.1 Thiosulfate sulfurtransferase, rhodanese [Bacillus sp. ZZV12-4809]MCM3091235.1 sulfurtransferase [Cytobacillus sp. AMY 15.2]
MKYLAEKEWVLSKMDDPKIRIADCRFKLGSPDVGRSLYEHNHIPNAVYFDLEKDLSGTVREHGGRHPLPDPAQLKNVLEQAGISRDTTVIAYDGGEGAFAARFWWLLRYLGHENVFVLNGGFKEWTESDYPLSKEVPSIERADFKIELQPDIVASYDEVKSAAGNQDSAVLIDSREEKRYLGQEEPIDKKAGHIPGAVNKVWLEAYRNGRFKDAGEQEIRFSEIDKDKPIIVYCGSGVTAAPNYLALKEAGYKNVKLYAGSFSDWISYDSNNIETVEK